MKISTVSTIRSRTNRSKEYENNLNESVVCSLHSPTNSLVTAVEEHRVRRAIKDSWRDCSLRPGTIELLDSVF